MYCRSKYNLLSSNCPNVSDLLSVIIKRKEKRVFMHQNNNIYFHLQGIIMLKILGEISRVANELVWNVVAVSQYVGTSVRRCRSPLDTERFYSPQTYLDLSSVSLAPDTASPPGWIWSRPMHCLDMLVKVSSIFENGITNGTHRDRTLVNCFLMLNFQLFWICLEITVATREHYYCTDERWREDFFHFYFETSYQNENYITKWSTFYIQNMSKDFKCLAIIRWQVRFAFKKMSTDE